MARLFCVLGLLTACGWLCGAQVTIINTGSTNVPGVNVTLDNSGPEATLERRGGSRQKIKLAQDMCSRLLADLKAAGPLNQLPARHCAKSASFGTSVFIEHNGVRSPDLSCPQSDARSAALKKDAYAIMSTAKTYSPKAF